METKFDEFMDEQHPSATDPERGMAWSAWVKQKNNYKPLVETCKTLGKVASDCDCGLALAAALDDIEEALETLKEVAEDEN